MQVDLILKNKVLSLAEGSPTEWLVTDNGDYQLHIDILDERQLATFAVFVKDGKAIECDVDEDGYVLNSDNERAVPLWAIDCPYMTVGVIAGDYATLPLAIPTRGSIKRLYEEEIVQPDDPLVEQLIELVNSIETLPPVTQDDNGKVAKVVNGAWTAAEESGGINFTTDETLTLVNNVLSVNTTNDAAQDNTLPITSAGVNTIVGNINALLHTI